MSEDKSNSKIQICWICHSECGAYNNQFKQKCESPCLCKGSMERVHRECLNAYVTKRYKAILDSLDDQNVDEDSLREKFRIKCPNCKFAMKYEVQELPPQRLCNIFKTVQPEKMILMTLIGIQVTLLLIDWFKPFENFQFIQNDLSDKDIIEKIILRPEQSINFINVIYTLTVIIILAAATYNLIFDSSINWAIEIKDKDYSSISKPNNMHKIKRK